MTEQASESRSSDLTGLIAYLVGEAALLRTSEQRSDPGVQAKIEQLLGWADQVAARHVIVPELTAWREARHESKRTLSVYNDALEKARQIDEIQGFGFTNVNDEFQAMTAASNQAFRLVKPMLDALDAMMAQPAHIRRPSQPVCLDTPALHEICRKQTNSKAVETYGEAFMRIAEAVQDEVLAANAPVGVVGRTEPRDDDQRAAAQYYADNPSMALLAFERQLAAKRSPTPNTLLAALPQEILQWAEDQNYSRVEPATEEELSGVAHWRYGAFFTPDITIEQWTAVANCVIAARLRALLGIGRVHSQTVVEDPPRQILEDETS